MMHINVEPCQTAYSESWKNLVDFTQRYASAHVAMFRPIYDFDYRDDDVFISVYPKCGTTWMQQIVHQVRTGGNEDFEAITDVVPWIMPENIVGQMTTYTQKASQYKPRAFKTHHAADVALTIGVNGGRHITVLRDPEAALISSYHFLPNVCNMDENKMTLEDYYFGFYSNVAYPNYWLSLTSWWKERHNPNVLIVYFEDMKKNLPIHIDLVSNFLSRSLSVEEKEKVLALCSFEHMKSHPEKYGQVEGVKMLRSKIKDFFGVNNEPDLPITGTVRKDQSSNAVITHKIRQHMQMMWQCLCKDVTKVENYSEMVKKYGIFKDK